MRRPAFYPAVVFFLLVFLRPSCAADAFTFEEHIRPILKQQCFHCHGEDPELPGGLDLRLVRLMISGGDSGTAIVPGNPEASLLWERIASDEMPEGPKKLSADQKATIRQWIEQGAKTSRPEPEDLTAARFTYEELSHWAFQPPRQPEPPSPAGYELLTPIDGFIAANLAENGLSFSAPADRRTLVRRASFDTLGLPPTPAQIEQFVADDDPGAWERLIARLLQSPQFGVRWARHWLDVAGYAETDGGDMGERVREHAWRYRDYVIGAFNENKPMDQFIVEQLAGDELIEGPLDKANPRHQELLTATAFLRMAPDATQSSNTLANRNTAVADTIKVVSSAMLGLTVGCAQCHDHKYDPIGMDDYYRFRSIFDPAFPLDQWQQPSAREVDFTSAETLAEAERIEAECKQLEEAWKQRRLEYAEKIYAEKLADVPESDRAAAKLAVETEVAQQTDEQKRLLKLYPMVKPASFIAGFLVEYDNAAYRRFQAESEEIQKLRDTKPAPSKIMATQERAGVVPESKVFFRGNPESPADTVEPAELFVLARHGEDHSIPANDETLPTTGRRLAYAKHLTHGNHPLVARVFVNRVWQHYFGRGLVETPSDFGISGGTPSHPKLLDWLASDFVASGWDHKRLHRLILLSATYRQASERREEQEKIDPENRLLARMNLRRLDAEATRDAMMQVAGQLTDSVSGPSIPVTEDQEGKIVIGKRKERDGLQVGVDGAQADDRRRSIFVQVKRKQALYMLETFDQPEMNPNCDVRPVTTVAPQSLFFLNDTEVIELARQFARRVLQSSENHQDCIRNAFQLAFGEPPSDDDLSACEEVLQQQLVHFADQKEPHLEAFSVLCQTLLASNRFLYVD